MLTPGHGGDPTGFPAEANPQKKPPDDAEDAVGELDAPAIEPKLSTPSRGQPRSIGARVANAYRRMADALSSPSKRATEQTQTMRAPAAASAAEHDTPTKHTHKKRKRNSRDSLASSNAVEDMLLLGMAEGHAVADMQPQRLFVDATELPTLVPDDTAQPLDAMRTDSDDERSLNGALEHRIPSAIHEVCDGLEREPELVVSQFVAPALRRLWDLVERLTQSKPTSPPGQGPTDIERRIERLEGVIAEIHAAVLRPRQPALASLQPETVTAVPQTALQTTTDPHSYAGRVAAGSTATAPAASGTAQPGTQNAAQGPAPTPAGKERRTAAGSGRHSAQRAIFQLQTPLTREELQERRAQAMQTYADINNALRATCGPAAPVITGVNWSENGNLVLLAREDMRAADVIKHSQTIIAAAHLEGAVYPREDTEWYKVALREVPTKAPDGSLIGEEAVLENLRICSPTFATLSLVDAPNPVQWCSAPAARAGIKKSSMVVSLTSQEDAATLLRLRTLYVFGARCMVTRYEERDAFTPCTNCWSPVARHRPSRCPGAARCRICAGQHHTDDHRCTECSEANGGDEDMSGATPKACAHLPAKCVNCMGAHEANDPRCSYRKKAKGSNAGAPPMAGTDNAAADTAPRPKRRGGRRKKQQEDTPVTGPDVAPASSQLDEGWIQEPARGPQDATGSREVEAATQAQPSRAENTLSREEEDQRQWNEMANALHGAFPKCPKKDCAQAVHEAAGDIERALELVRDFYVGQGMTAPGKKKLAAVVARFERPPASDAGREAEAEDRASVNKMAVEHIVHPGSA